MGAAKCTRWPRACVINHNINPTSMSCWCLKQNTGADLRPSYRRGVYGCSLWIYSVTHPWHAPLACLDTTRQSFIDPTTRYSSPGKAGLSDWCGVSCVETEKWLMPPRSHLCAWSGSEQAQSVLHCKSYCHCPPPLLAGMTAVTLPSNPSFVWWYVSLVFLCPQISYCDTCRGGWNDALFIDLDRIWM